MPKFVPRQRKHKVLAREKSRQNVDADGDSNALEILPEAQKANEAKKARMREELQGEAKFSSKKAKRLEKYIDNKLKKDENRELLAALAKNKIDTSLFSSSRTLGQGKETKRQALSRALRERQAGVSQGDESILFEPRDEPAGDSSDDDHDEDDDEKAEARALLTTSHQSHEKHQSPHDHLNASSAPPPSSTSIGSGLKRPLDLDDEGRPVLQKRQKRGGVKSKLAFKPAFAPPEPEDQSTQESSGEEGEDDEWNGFSSDESAQQSEDPVGSDSQADSDDSSAEEDSSDESESSEEEETPGSGGAKQRSSAFKAWAHEARNQALGYQSAVGDHTLNIPMPKDFKPRPLEQDPLPMELQPTAETGRKSHAVPITRSPEIQDTRLRLPVVAEESRLMEAIFNNNTVIICGSTGSGKTTQVPQFLFEAGYGSKNSPTKGMIGVTQPRRVAAVSMSKRVGFEMGDYSDRVAYQIRFESSISDKTAIKFMTDGVLFQEVANDIALRNYSAIIIDEAHERSANTDILIGMISRSVKLREELAKEDPDISPLKLIIMSATLRVDDLTKNSTLFSTPPPVLDVEGRQYPVTIHWARQTSFDYVDEAFKKITRGHRKLPPGSFLVFLTGYDEISRLGKKLKQSTGGLNSASLPKAKISANDAPLEVEDIDFADNNDDDYDQEDALDFMRDEQSEDEDEAEFDVSEETGSGPAPMKMHILPLYSLLPTKDQMRVFEDPPDGSRAIILATNIAETSLTIPGVKYVFDCGRSKERIFNSETGVQTYEVGFISKASANQRSGRAGRTAPGHAWRLYSSAVYERDFPEFATPELLRMPIEGVVLKLKAMNLAKVANFPFPTPPPRHMLLKAEKVLQYLSAVTTSGLATRTGSIMARFPLPPRFARILLIGHLHECLPYTIALVAGFSVPEIFIPEGQAIPALPDDAGQTFRTNEDVAAENQQKEARRRFNAVHADFRSLDHTSDAIKLLSVVCQFAHEPTESWCTSHFVRYKALAETQKLRKQLTDILQKDIPSFANLRFQEKLDRPSTSQITWLKQMVAAGFIDQVAIRADLAPNPPEMTRKPKRAIDVPYMPLQPLQEEKTVFIHPSSSLAHLSPQECPEYIIYSNLQKAALDPSSVKQPKTRMLAVTDVTGQQLAALAKGTPLITYGKPIKEVKGDKILEREVWVVPYLRAEGTPGQGWTLPVKKVKQKKVTGKGWVAE
ncbi:P-loop containing nucleoside triphosphate hydrolase protein [Xylariaceae sp. FL0016]|nr:P-loop containing nucleoside triphosphate hydrolase protein [Xylariaceae sp. FL0016]